MKPMKPSEHASDESSSDPSKIEPSEPEQTDSGHESPARTKRPVNPRAKKSETKRSARSMRDETPAMLTLHEAMAPFVLRCAQALSILGCIASIFYPIYAFVKLNDAGLLKDLTPFGYCTVLGTAICGFVYSYAMAIVFSRTRATRETQNKRSLTRIK